MAQIIRREQRGRRRHWSRGLVAGAGVLWVFGGSVLALAWQRGGPQPLHEIAIQLPARKVGG